MANGVDGNTHFLNQYMDKLEREEYKGLTPTEAEEKEEFTGEEMFDLLSSHGFSYAERIYERYIEEFPKGGFEIGLDIARKYNKKRETVPALAYIKGLTSKFYDSVGYWLDTKWLAQQGSESGILDNVLEFISDIVYEEEVISVEDYVTTLTIGYELAECVEKMDAREEQKVNGLLRAKRKDVALKGLQEAGLTKEFVINRSPEEVNTKLLMNLKRVGNHKKRLQVSNELAEEGLKTMGLLPKTGKSDRVTAQNYATIYGMYKKPTTNALFPKVVNLFGEELNHREDTNPSLRVDKKVCLDEKLFIIITKNSWVVIGGTVTVFMDRGEGLRKVYSKPLNSVRVKDVKKLVSVMN